MAAARLPLSFQSFATRTAIVCSFWLAILLSIPSWLKTTTILRLPLPVHDILALQANRTCPIYLPASVQVHVEPELFRSSDLTSQAEQLILDSLTVRSQSKAPEATYLACTNWSVSIVPGTAPAGTEADYVFHASSRPPTNQTAPVSFIPLDPSNDPIPEAITTAVIRHLFTHDAVVEDQGATLEQDPRMIQYARHVRLIFSLMNQDATKGDAFDSSILRELGSSDSSSNPVLQLLHQLEDVHDFHIESQVQWIAPLHFTPTVEEKELVTEEEVQEEYDVEIEEQIQVPPEPPLSDPDTDTDTHVDSDEDEVQAALPVTRKVRRTITQVRKVLKPVVHTHTEHLVEFDDLKVFVNSAEWSLVSTVPPRGATGATGATHDLHLLLYVPSRDVRPLRIRDPETGQAAESGAWLIPQWGGVVIVNPDPSTSAQDGELPATQVDEAMALFAEQLATLLGFQGDVHALKSRRMLETARETIETLSSITRLVDKIENLGVGPQIVHDVTQAIHTLRNATTLQHTFKAQSLAAAAFFNPDMLGLLYFPDEHKYAVYTPLFGPLLVPLAVAAIRTLNEWRRRSKQKSQRQRRRSKTPRSSAVSVSAN